MNPGYFAVIPANVRYDERLKPNAKLLYGEITALVNKEGYCWADNAYFSSLYNVSIETISRWISQLNEFGYVEVEVIKSEGNKRKITIDKKVKTSRQKSQDLLTKKSRPIDKKINSYIRINNTINNTINKEENPLAFLKENSPSLFENLQMKYRRQISDFDFALEQGNLKIQTEDIEWTSDKIFSRFQYFLNNWSRNQSKYKTNNQAEGSSESLPQNKKIVL